MVSFGPLLLIFHPRPTIHGERSDKLGPKYSTSAYVWMVSVLLHNLSLNREVNNSDKRSDSSLATSFLKISEKSGKRQMPDGPQAL